MHVIRRRGWEIPERLATPEQLQRVACPVGVSIRSQSPQEIAVSIMAQYIDKRAELVFGRQSRRRN